MIPTLGLSSLLYLCNCIAFILWASCTVSINLFQPSQKSETTQELNCHWNGILRNPLVKIWRRKIFFRQLPNMKTNKTALGLQEKIAKEILRNSLRNLSSHGMMPQVRGAPNRIFNELFFSKHHDLFLSVYNDLFLYKPSGSLSFSPK